MKFKSLVAALVMLGVGAANADMRNGLPRGEQGALATADYGGYNASTWTINATIIGYSTVTLPGNVGVPLDKNLTNGISGVFFGFQFSSGTSADFVDVYDSTSSDAGKNSGQFMRIYNVANSTGGVGASAAGFSGPEKPIRFSKGLIFRPSRSDFISLNALFNVDK